ncbi:hypothetical protein [Pseudomonas sp. 31 R 17]|uniref:hypothetical protein n=1 Tax=Pseudomonas sp. 31 R 17 TaxID=1844101 RepID=UPI0008127826|nr:hypothetical protein [Pseudomonas sp. 31 R 17]CRM19770.1 hypothetical protein [Pseudomonas sp. 31 R 17]
MYELYIGPKPLNFPNAEKPGAYKLLSRIAENTYNPGDTIKLEQFITGYGSNSGFKIICHMSDNLFDETQSTLITGLQAPTADNPMLRWGAEEVHISNGGYSFILSSMQNDRWKTPAQTFDTKQHLNYVITERNLSGAPISYSLKLKKTVRPGMHYLTSYMTFFNGQEWTCQEERIPFKINNTFERYNTLLSALAAAALMVTIFHDGVAPLIECFHDLGKFITALHQK